MINADDNVPDRATDDPVSRAGDGFSPAGPVAGTPVLRGTPDPRGRFIEHPKAAGLHVLRQVSTDWAKLAPSRTSARADARTGPRMPARVVPRVAAVERQLPGEIVGALAPSPWIQSGRITQISTNRAKRGSRR